MYICDFGVSMCFRHPFYILTYFSWESLPGYWNQTIKTRILPCGHKTIHFVPHEVAHIESRLYVYMFSIFIFYQIRIAHTESWLKIEIPYMYPCVSDTPLTFWPIFLGKACQDTRIRWLNAESYDPDCKNMDLTIRFATIATRSNPFYRIQK